MGHQTVIDKTDRKILRALLEDARCNFSEIARDCNVSTTAIAQRYKKLERNGIIAGTTIIGVPKNQYSLSVDIRAQSDCENAIIETIKKIPGTLNCFQTVGKYDIHAAIRVNSLEQADQTKNTIKKQNGVLEIEITTNLDELFFFPENLLKP